MDSSIFPFPLQLPADLPCAFSLQALHACLSTLVDRRARRGVRYPLAPLLTLAVCAKLAGQSRVESLAHWARLRAPQLAQLFGLKRQTMPHPSTWSRILGHAVDVAALEHTLSRFFQAQQPLPPTPARGSRLLIVDGKTVRGTIPFEHTSGVHLVAAYLPDEGVVLAQMAVAQKENEIVVVPTLLATLALSGTVVVGDAMQTQRALSRQIVEAGGDYLWFVKDNQPTLHDDIETLFTPPPLAIGSTAMPTDFVTAQRIDKGHGRLEVRTLTASSLLQPYSDWPYLAQVFKLERWVQRGQHITIEVRYGVSSLPVTVASAERLLTIARSGWQIEHGLHYRRDVTLAEDHGHLRRGTGPHVMAALNNVVIALLYQQEDRNLAALQRRFAYHFERMLLHLGAAASPT